MILVTDQEENALLDLIEGRFAMLPDQRAALRSLGIKLHDSRAAREEAERVRQNAIQPRDRRR